MSTATYADVNADMLRTLVRPKPAYYLLLLGFVVALAIGGPFKNAGNADFVIAMQDLDERFHILLGRKIGARQKPPQLGIGADDHNQQCRMCGGGGRPITPVVLPPSSHVD